MLQIEIEPTQSAAAIRDYLWGRDDLLDLTDPIIGPSAHPIGGHCYVASEAFYHLEGGKEYWKPMSLKVVWHDTGTRMSCSHWFLKNKKTDRIVDLTADQFRDNNIQVDYDAATGQGFVPPTPSSRAEKVIEKIQYD